MRAIALASVLAMASVAGSGCSLLVDPDDRPLACVSGADGDPCPVGLECRGGTCQPMGVDGGAVDVPRIDGCTPDPLGERCNGEDDDCNGMIDEDALSDVDNDGYTWCGSGDPARVDCNDSDPFTYPGAEERCDARDNNCNHMVDEGAEASCATAGDLCRDGMCFGASDCRLTSCPSSQTCDTNQTPARCVTPTCTPGSCTGMEEICDTVSGTCVVTRALGEECGSDAECKSSVCAPREASRITTGAAQFCTQACCVDEDCPADFVCYASGTGAKLCVAGSVVGLTRGPIVDDTSCSTHSDCASGVCDEVGFCIANCSRDADCDQVCAVESYMRRSSTISHPLCDLPIGSGHLNAWCLSYADCRSGVCIPDGSFSGVCSQPCHTSADCGGTLSACRNRYLGTADARANVPICDSPLGAGGASAGCVDSTECREGGCVRASNGMRYCAQTCCSNADCGGGGRCKPYLLGGDWSMHCAPG